MYHEVIWPSNQSVDVRRYPFLGVGPDFKREIRLAPQGIESSMGYWIYLNKVLFTSSRTEGYSFIVESNELVQMMTAQHQGIWSISTKKEINPKHTQSFLDELDKNLT